MYYRMLMTLLCVVSAWSVSAQKAPVPDNYEIKTAADCARYNDDVLRCAEWLRTTPYDRARAGEWQRAGAFLMAWSMGTADVMFELSEEAAPFLTSNLETEVSTLLLSVYLAGGSEYALKGGDGKNTAAVARAGGDAVIAVYQAGRGTLGKIREIETMIKQRKKDK